MVIDEEEEDEEDLEQNAVAVDDEGQIIYDRNVIRPDYKLFTLRNNSCLNYHSLIDFDKSVQDTTTANHHKSTELQLQPLK